MPLKELPQLQLLLNCYCAAILRKKGVSCNPCLWRHHFATVFFFCRKRTFPFVLQLWPWSSYCSLIILVLEGLLDYFQLLKFSFLLKKVKITMQKTNWRLFPNLFFLQTLQEKKVIFFFEGKVAYQFYICHNLWNCSPPWGNILYPHLTRRSYQQIL